MIQLGCIEQPRLADTAPEVFEAIALLAQAPDLVLAAIELRVAGMVAVEPAGVDLDRTGALTGAGALDGFARRFMYFEEIVAADLDGGQPKASRPSGDIAAADRVLERRAFAVLVVLEDENRREFQYHRHVHRLEGGALVRAAIAGERLRDGIAVEGLGGQRGADDERRPAADNAVGAEHPAVELGDMHRASL